MRHLAAYFKKYKMETFIAPLFKMMEACFDLAVPLIVAKIIDVGIAGQDRQYIFTHFLLLIGMAVLGLLCSFAAQYFAARAAVGTATGLRHELMEKLQSLEVRQLDQIGSATLITRMTSDVNQVQNGINMFLRLFLRSPFIVFGAMILAFTINNRIALIFVGVIIVLFLIVFGIMAISAPMYRDVQQKLDGVTRQTRESLGGVRVIRAFGREASEQQKFRAVNDRLLAALLRVGRVSALLNPLTYTVINAAIVLILWWGADMVNGGILLAGNVIALINYISQILVELVKLANLVVLLGKSVASMGRIGQVLDTESTLCYSNEKGLEQEEIIRFEDVSLRYAETGDEALSHLSFSVMRGQSVGIIGGTGSGKSSLVHLIARLYDATGGCVYLDGVPIQALSRQSILSKVAIVDQKPRLFTGTIRSNLLWGDSDADDTALWQALEAAQAADFVHAKPKGLDEPVEQGGANFSGGQKQRLTIARALLRRADILILDDSASALDFATDAALRRAIAALPESKTRLIVSQRAGSVMHADQILVLDDGRLVGVGTHETLMKSCDVYREIYESQFDEEVGA